MPLLDKNQLFVRWCHVMITYRYIGVLHANGSSWFSLEFYSYSYISIRNQVALFPFWTKRRFRLEQFN